MLSPNETGMEEKELQYMSDPIDTALGEGHVRARGGVTLRARAEDLEDRLHRLEQSGIDCVELDAGALDVIYRGQLHRPRLERIVETVTESPLEVTVHQGSSLDLRTDLEIDVMQDLLFSMIDLSQEIDASVLVIHYESPSDDDEVEAQFEKLLLAGADRTEGLILGVENIEVAPSARVVALIEKLDHPAIKMTWDIGHDVLAADWFGYDIGEAAKRCAPYVAHIHAQDNFGSFEPLRTTDRATYSRKGKVYFSALGRGDLHMPIGWGNIGWEEVLAPLSEIGYTGAVVSEVLDRFYEWHLDDIVSGVNRVVEILTTEELGSAQRQDSQSNRHA